MVESLPFLRAVIEQALSTIETKPADEIPHKRVGRNRFWIDKPNSKLDRPPVSQTYWAQEQDEIECGLSLDLRSDLLTHYGNFTLAYSVAVQPRLQYFGDEEGYLAYRKRWGNTFVLGDIVAADDRKPDLLDQFIDDHQRLMFCQVHRPMAELLADRGFYVNEMGVDTRLELQEYDFKGKQKEWLRYASNWTRRNGYQIVESDFDEVTPFQIEEVSEAWRKTRTVKRKEVRFLNRPIVMKKEPDVRRFFLFSPDRQLLAFVFLDPVYENGKPIGYVTSFKRRHPDAPVYAEHAIMKFVIEKLKFEGVQELRLGLSPFAWIEDADFRHSRINQWLFRKAFESPGFNRHCYNVKGHADYKRRFRGSEEKVYLASRSRISSLQLLALLGLCGFA